MEKFSYNNFDNFEGMDIEEPFDYKIDDKIKVLNELEYFQLFFDDEIMNFFEQESNEYVTNILIKNMVEILKNLY